MDWAGGVAHRDEEALLIEAGRAKEGRAFG